MDLFLLFVCGLLFVWNITLLELNKRYETIIYNLRKESEKN